ncbi:S-adenosylmethionine:tRNA ribosyltransferase-isomerase, partial [Rhizobium ruizarguesonis]
NFHLPRSTLFMLVSAFAGFETMHAPFQLCTSKRAGLLHSGRPSAEGDPAHSKHKPGKSLSFQRT